MELLIKLNNNLSNRHIHNNNNINKSIVGTEKYFSDNSEQQEQSIHHKEQHQPQQAKPSVDDNLENLLNVKINCLTRDNWLIL